MTWNGILHVTTLRRVGDHTLRLWFNDGTRKCVNVLPLLRRGALRRLRDPREFARVHLDRTWGVPKWPGDLDIAPEALRDLPDEPVPSKRALRPSRSRSRPHARR
jgi:hypothetical protein